MAVDTCGGWRNSLCFFFFGLISVLHQRIFSIATQDILAGSDYPTMIVILSMSLPELITKITAPWIVYRISYTVSFIAGILLTTASIVLVVAVDSIPVRLCGCSAIGVSLAWNLSLFVAIAARFPNIIELTSAMQTGVNAGSMIAAFYYTGFTISACVAPRIAIAATIAFLVVLIISYLLLDRGPVDTKPQEDHHKDIQYHKLQENEEEEGSLKEHESCSGRLRLLWRVLRVCLFLYVGFASFYFSHYSVLTTLAFPNAPFPPEHHFQYYTLAFSVSRFLGGSELLFVSRLCPTLLPYFRVKRLWVLSFLDFVHVMFFTFASWYRFVPHVSIILVLCFSHGFICGTVMLNGILVAADEFDSSEEKGIAMGMIQWGTTAGSLGASIGGLFVEPELRRHCKTELHLGEYCFTRANQINGWTSTICST